MGVETWVSMNRRQFLKTALALGCSAVLPFSSSPLGDSYRGKAMSWWNIFSRRPVDKTVNRFELNEIEIWIYNDERHLHFEMAKHGILTKRRGYYFQVRSVPEIHCIRDEKVLGHEMFHALGLIEENE